MSRSQSVFAALMAMALLAAVLVLGTAYGRTIDPDRPDEVASGLRVWRRYGCEGCHTLYGQGGGYAPDLTHSYGQRGEAYLREFMVNPSAFHPGQRPMPQFSITQDEVNSVLALLRRIDSEPVAADDWPLRPIRVAGSTAFSDVAAQANSEAANPQLTQGRLLFSQRCASCHSLKPDVVLVGPSLWSIATTAQNRVAGQRAQDYIRNSILFPSDYLVEGFPDVMQKNFADVLTSSELDALTAYLMTLNEAEGGNQ